MFNEKRSENIIWTRYRWNGCVVKWISWLGVNDCAAAWQLAPAPAAVQERSQLSVKHWTVCDWVLPLMVLSPSVTRQWPTCHDLSDSLSIPAWHTIRQLLIKTAAAVSSSLLPYCVSILKLKQSLFCCRCRRTRMTIDNEFVQTQTLQVAGWLLHL